VDQNNSNDTTIVSVTHLFPNDLGVTQLISPKSGSGLTQSEQVTVNIENFGGEPQSAFDVTYILDGQEPVTEQVMDTVPGTGSLNYTFSQTADLSALGEYEFTAFTSLLADSDNSNDTMMDVVVNEICQPVMDCSYGDGISHFHLGEIDNLSGCDPDGYGDYAHLMTDVEIDYTNYSIITTNYGSQYVKQWIDQNDNFVFENDEVVINNYVIAPGQDQGFFKDTIEFMVPGTFNLGEHLMRVKTNWNSGVPDNACEPTEYGETEDYTVHLVLPTGIHNQVNEPNELIISRNGDQFKVSFDAISLTEDLIITVHNISGQKLIRNKVFQNNGRYEFEFDMSYAPSGMYLVRLGNASFGKIKKIVVN
jgi:hypothetical protein